MNLGATVTHVDETYHFQGKVIGLSNKRGVLVLWTEYPGGDEAYWEWEDPDALNVKAA